MPDEPRKVLKIARRLAAREDADAGDPAPSTGSRVAELVMSVLLVRDAPHECAGTDVVVAYPLWGLSQRLRNPQHEVLTLP